MENELSHQIIGASIEVHRTFGGPGLLESIYEAALCHELTLRGLRIQRQRPAQVLYKGIAIRDHYLLMSSLKIKSSLRLKLLKKITQSMKHNFLRI